MITSKKRKDPKEWPLTFNYNHPDQPKQLAKKEVWKKYWQQKKDGRFVIIDLGEFTNTKFASMPFCTLSHVNCIICIISCQHLTNFSEKNQQLLWKRWVQHFDGWESRRTTDRVLIQKTTRFHVYSQADHEVIELGGHHLAGTLKVGGGFFFFFFSEFFFWASRNLRWETRINKCFYR